MRPGFAFLLLIPALASASAEHFTWAKGAHHFHAECPQDKSRCTLARVLSPDHGSALLARVTDGVLTLSIVHGAKGYELVGTLGSMPPVDLEVLWSPDSSAVSISWNETGITHKTEAFVVTPHGPRLLNLAPVMQDFSRDFPPCVESHDPGPCPYASNGSDANYLAVAWASPHTLVLMAEAGESSSYGKNLAQLEGYEIDASDGKILRELTAAAFKSRWQSHMGWRFRIPEPPES